MIPHIHTLFEFISIPYENQHQLLIIKKIEKGTAGACAPALSKVEGHKLVCAPTTFGQTVFVVKNAKFSSLASLANFTLLIFSKRS